MKCLIKELDLEKIAYGIDKPVGKILKAIENNGFLTLQNHYKNIPNTIFVKGKGFLKILPEYDINEHSEITKESNYTRTPWGGYCLIGEKTYNAYRDVVLIYLYSKPMVLAKYLSEIYKEEINSEDFKMENIIDTLNNQSDKYIFKKSKLILKNNFKIKDDVFIKFKKNIIQVRNGNIVEILKNGVGKNEGEFTCKSKHERKIIHGIVRGESGSSIHAMASR